MSEPQIVYHYTSIDTLLKIVLAEKGKEGIWATNIRYLNDDREREHCLNMMRHRLSEYLQKFKPACGQALAKGLDKIANPAWLVPYVASFSSDIDSLPQWRAYCANGNGVSIGFKVEALKQCVLSKEHVERIIHPRATFAPIKYLADNDLTMVDTLFEEGGLNRSMQHHLMWR